MMLSESVRNIIVVCRVPWVTQMATDLPVIIVKPQVVTIEEIQAGVADYHIGTKVCIKLQFMAVITVPVTVSGCVRWRHVMCDHCRRCVGEVSRGEDAGAV